MSMPDFFRLLSGDEGGEGEYSRHNIHPDDPTGGGFLVVIALVFGLLTKTVLKYILLKHVPLPYTVVLLIAGIGLALLVGWGDCEYMESSSHRLLSGDSNDDDSNGNETHTTKGEFCTHIGKWECEDADKCNWDGKMEWGVFGYSIDVWTSINPHLVMYTFLPALIYGSSHLVDIHVFSASFWQVMALAGPGVAIATGITATLTFYVADALDFGWGWWTCLTFGAMLSATDPVAVVALLHELGAPRKLGIVIEGESLFNDGTALVVFLVCFEAMKGDALGPGPLIAFFLQLALGGCAVGFLCGFVMVWILKYLQEPLLEVILTLIFAYGTFILCEQIKVSGVLGTVALGLVMSAYGKPLLTSQEFMHHFWEMLEFIANTVIFVMAGLIIGEALLSEIIGAKDWGFLFIIYIIIHISRTIVNIVLAPYLQRSGYGITKEEIMVMSWAGLRGAVGLALGMVLEQTSSDDFDCTTSLYNFHNNNNGHIDGNTCGGDYTDEQCCESGYDQNGVAWSEQIGNMQTRILFQCGGIAALTLIINASTTGALVKYLGLVTQNTASKFSFDFIARHIAQRNEEKKHELVRNDICKDFYGLMDHTKVTDYLPIFSEELLRERSENNQIEWKTFKLWDKSELFHELRERFHTSEVEEELAMAKSFSEDKEKEGCFKGSSWPTHWRTGQSMKDKEGGYVFDAASDLWGKTEEEAKLHRLRFIQHHWSQIVEARRRTIGMISRTYWHDYEEGLSGRDALQRLLEVTEQAQDDINRSPLRPPGKGEGEKSKTVKECLAICEKYKLDEFKHLEMYLVPGWIEDLQNFGTRCCGVQMARRLGFGQYSFKRYEFILDTVIDFRRCHEKVYALLQEMRKDTLEDVDTGKIMSNKLLGSYIEHNNMHPVVMEMVQWEVQDAVKASKKYYAEIFSSESALIKNIATYHTIRHLLKDAEKHVRETHEVGKIDEKEEHILLEAIKDCSLRLITDPPSRLPPTTPQQLRRVPYLATFGKDQMQLLEAIAKTTIIRTVYKNHKLYSQEERPQSVFLILSGKVSLFRYDKRDAAEAKQKIAHEADEAKYADRNFLDKHTMHNVDVRHYDDYDNDTLTKLYGPELFSANDGQVLGSLENLKGIPLLTTAVARDKMVLAMEINLAKFKEVLKASIAGPSKGRQSRVLLHKLKLLAGSGLIKKTKEQIRESEEAKSNVDKDPFVVEITKNPLAGSTDGGAVATKTEESQPSDIFKKAKEDAMSKKHGGGHLHRTTMTGIDHKTGMYIPNTPVEVIKLGTKLGRTARVVDPSWNGRVRVVLMGLGSGETEEDVKGHKYYQKEIKVKVRSDSKTGEEETIIYSGILTSYKMGELKVAQSFVDAKVVKAKESQKQMQRGTPVRILPKLKEHPFADRQCGLVVEQKSTDGSVKIRFPRDGESGEYDLVDIMADELVVIPNWLQLIDHTSDKKKMHYKGERFEVRKAGKKFGRRGGMLNKHNKERVIVKLDPLDNDVDRKLVDDYDKLKAAAKRVGAPQPEASKEYKKMFIKSYRIMGTKEGGAPEIKVITEEQTQESEEDDVSLSKLRLSHAMARQCEKNICTYSGFLAVQIFLKETYFPDWTNHELSVMLKTCEYVRPDLHKKEAGDSLWTQTLSAPAILLTGSVTLVSSAGNNECPVCGDTIKRCKVQGELTLCTKETHKNSSGIIFLNPPASTETTDDAHMDDDPNTWRYVTRVFKFGADEHGEPPRLLVLGARQSLVWGRQHQKIVEMQKQKKERQEASVFFPWKIGRGDDSPNETKGLLFSEASKGTMNKWAGQGKKKKQKKQQPKGSETRGAAATKDDAPMPVAAAAAAEPAAGDGLELKTIPASDATVVEMR